MLNRCSQEPGSSATVDSHTHDENSCASDTIDARVPGVLVNPTRQVEITPVATPVIPAEDDLSCALRKLESALEDYKSRREDISKEERNEGDRCLDQVMEWKAQFERLLKPRPSKYSLKDSFRVNP